MLVSDVAQSSEMAMWRKEANWMGLTGWAWAMEKNLKGVRRRQVGKGGVEVK